MRRSFILSSRDKVPTHCNANRIGSTWRFSPLSERPALCLQFWRRCLQRLLTGFNREIDVQQPSRTPVKRVIHSEEPRHAPTHMRWGKGGSHDNRSIKSRVVGMSLMALAIKDRVNASRSFCGRPRWWRSVRKNMFTGYRSRAATKRWCFSFKGTESRPQRGA